jgi:hypothetical protein
LPCVSTDCLKVTEGSIRQIQFHDRISILTDLGRAC